MSCYCDKKKPPGRDCKNIPLSCYAVRYLSSLFIPRSHVLLKNSAIIY
jgi:hypothetical protein